MDFYSKTKQTLASFGDERFFKDRHFFFNTNIVLQEVPDEISICFNISGCQLNCPGCSWRNLEMTPRELTREFYTEILNQNKGLASCVVFMGGEWKHAELVWLLDTAREMGFKTALYTGQNHITLDLLQRLDYVKMGPWRPQHGPLNSNTTNQVFFKLEQITHKFQKNSDKANACPLNQE